MPSNYTDYNPDQPLSPEQVTALSEVKKIIEARIIYNRNLLEFILNKKNETATNTLIKTLLHVTNTDSLPPIKKKFINNICNDLKYFQLYIQHIVETCQTTATFDDLYFQIFMALESQKYHETEVPKREEDLLKFKNISSTERKQRLEDSKKLKKEKDISELEYYQEIFSILEKGKISQRASQFKEHHQFVPMLNLENVAFVGIGCKTLEKLYSSIMALNKKLAQLPNKHISLSKNFEEIHQMHIAIKTVNIEPYKQKLPSHHLDFFESFNVYRIMRQFFDLCINFLSESDKLLELQQKRPKKNKKVKTTTTPASEFSIEAVVEQEECAAALTEVAPLVAVPVTQPTELQAEVSQSMLAFPMQEQKNDTPIPLIELSEIHPALQFIAALHSKESATLLSWAKKAPHMKVEFGELTRIIKQLGGKIDMSGGGSHHRIIFKNSLAFIDIFEQDSRTGTESTIKGTLVKQHGKGKSSRFLPSYAIKTFMQTLKKMGITETVLRIYTDAHNSCTTFKNPKNNMVFLTTAQKALVKDQSEIFLLLCVYKSKKDKKGNYPALRKLNPEADDSNRTKQGTLKLIQNISSFL